MYSLRFFFLRDFISPHFQRYFYWVWDSGLTGFLSALVTPLSSGLRHSIIFCFLCRSCVIFFSGLVFKILFVLAFCCCFSIFGMPSMCIHLFGVLWASWMYGLMSVLNFGKSPTFISSTISLLVWFHLASCAPTTHHKKSIPWAAASASAWVPEGTTKNKPNPFNTGAQPSLNLKQSCLAESSVDSWTTVTVDLAICVRQKCFWWKDQRPRERKKKFIMTG